LEWTGKNGRRENRGSIPDDLGRVLERLGIASSMWCDLVWNYKKYFGRSNGAGRPESLKDNAAKNQRAFAPGQRASSKCFA
jgi:hypothetical protein